MSKNTDNITANSKVPIIPVRETWILNNISNQTLTITDLPNIPAILPKTQIDILQYSSFREITFSHVLRNYIDKNWLVPEEYLHTHDDKSYTDHIIQSHVDTNATGAQLNVLTLGYESNADLLHSHNIVADVGSDSLHTLTDGSNADLLHIHSFGGEIKHNDLLDIDGGELNEYYHLNLKNYDNLSKIEATYTEINQALKGIGSSVTYSNLDILTNKSDADLLHDHSQFIKIDGTRAFTGVVSGIDPTVDANLATKKYVDDITFWDRTGSTLFPKNAGDNIIITGIGTFGDGSALTTSAAPTSDVMISNKKYVDDQITGIDFWDRTGTVLSPKNAGDEISVTGDISIEADSVQLNLGASKDAQIQYVSGTGLQITDTTTGLINFSNDNLSTSGSFNSAYIKCIATDNYCLGSNTTFASIVGANSNIAIGENAGNLIVDGDYNILIGGEAGKALTSETDNILIGYNAGVEITTSHNIGIGYETLYTVAGGSANNVAVGYQALHGNGAVTKNHAFNVAVGYQTGYSIDSGDYNVLIGYKAGDSVTNGASNILIGRDAGSDITTERDNILIGYYTGIDVTSQYNIGIGAYALYTSVGGTGENVAVGYGALRGNGAATKTHTYNVGIGSGAGYSIDSGQKNVFSGASAGLLVATGSENVAVGYSSLSTSTNTDYTTCIGVESLCLTSSGSANIGIGYRGGYNVTTGNYNIAIGNETISIAALTGSGNVTVGYQSSLNLNGAANENVSIGYQSLYSAGVANYNVAGGAYALYGVTTGANNVGLGYQVGYSSNVSGCVLIGYQSGYNNARDNTLMIDNSNTATPLIYGKFDDNELTINGNFEINGNVISDIFISSYENRLYFGEDNEASIYFDGCDLVIGLNNISCECNPSVGCQIKLDGDVEILGTIFGEIVFNQEITCGGGESGQSIIGSGLVVNEDSGAAVTDDFRAETTSNASALVVDASADEVLTAVIFKANAGLNTKVSTDDVADPPTDANLDAAFGTPVALGAGFVGIVDDNSGDTDVWLCYTSDTSWFYLQGVKAI